MKKYQFLFPVVSLLIGSLLLTGCPPKNKLDIEEPPIEEDLDATDQDADSTAEPDIEISQDWSDVPALGVITFDYDAASLGAPQRAILKQNVAVIKKLPDTVTLRVEGHCDDRGTIEYNIALGQRRANAVRSFYVTAGISRDRIKTISFGEERPSCTAQTDECWKKNRRSVTKARSPEAISVSPDDLK